MPNDIMRQAMQDLDAEDARAELTPMHRLLLDLATFVSRYKDLANADADTHHDLKESVVCIENAFEECADAIEKIAREYLAPDGSVLPGPTVLVEVEDGAHEIGTYNYPVDVVLIDWDAAEDDGEYTEERKDDIRQSALPDMVKSTLFERLNSF